MTTRVYEDEVFEERVQFAKQCLLSGQTDCREFDTCFEMYDDDLVVVRLLQEAENNEQLREQLQRYDIAWVRSRLYPLLKNVGPSELAELAGTLRDRFQGNGRKMWPQLPSEE